MNEWMKIQIQAKSVNWRTCIYNCGGVMRFKKIRLEQTNAIYLDMFTITLSTSCTVFVNVAMNWNWHNFRFVPKSNRNVENFLLKRIFLWKMRIFFFRKKNQFSKEITSIQINEYWFLPKTEWHQNWLTFNICKQCGKFAWFHDRCRSRFI